MQKRPEEDKMEKEKDNNTQFIFESLTPVENNDLGIYESALNYVFDNPDIKNVALSGAYGAGKSSVLATYKKRTADKNRNYIHITLAHFDDEDESSDARTIKESVLEGKILNQLIHQIPEKNIPQTNFRVKSTAPKKTIIVYSLILSLLILLCLHLTMSSNWENFIQTFQDGRLKIYLSLSVTPLAYLLSGILLFGLIAFLIYQAVKLQKNRRILKKLNLQGNEIEIFEDSKDSYFDKYLNEVLYLFENANADVIVFEDMDRFDANQIFERLREVNTLINLRTKGRIIRFFYLLKDDIFTSKDRTKFFDFIIPIVPVVDGSNSYDQFITHLQRNDLLVKFDEHFLKGLSLYVDEMRLLKNICNEFLIYYNRLNTTELDYNKMLALITYKNLFPRDFSELQLGRGFVHALFENKESYISAEMEKLGKVISEAEIRIEQLNSEALDSSEELAIVYTKKREKYSTYWNHKEIDRLNTEEQSRKQRIEERYAGKVNELQELIDKTKRAITTLKAKPLHEIINRDNIESIFQTVEIDEIGNENQFLDVKSNAYFPLLKYLIRNGYIDESFSDYMTYFYENSISRTDKIFLRSVTDKKARNYEYELKEPQKVLEQLDESDFDQEEILNYCLTDFLLQSHPKSQYIQHLIRQLQKKKNYDFTTGYLKASKAPIEFVRQCNLNWNELFKCLLDDSALSERELNQYAVLTLYSSDDRAIELSNTEKCITEYISASKTFLEIEEPRIDCLIQGFCLISVLFEHLDYNSSNKNLFMAVYEKNLYVISFDNLREILWNVYGIKDEDRILHSNYSSIYELFGTPIKEYVEANISDYTDIMLEFCEGRITDENEAVKAILNNSVLSLEQKTQYIKCLKKPLLDIAEIEDPELWPKLINYGAVVFSEENVLDYFNYSQKSDQFFARLINAAEREINFTTIYDSTDKDEIGRLFDSIVSCNEIEDEKYEQCIASIDHQYEAFSISGLSTEKVLILNKHNVIQMNLETLNFMRKNYVDAIYEYIYSHANEYVALIDERSFTYSEMLQFLSMEVSDELKLKLLEHTNEPISVIDKGYSDIINTYLLTNNLDESDMPKLFIIYDACSIEVQKIILNYSKRIPEILAANTEDCSLKLINDFFSDPTITREIKSSILSALITRLTKDQAIDYFTMLGLVEYVKIFDSHARPKFRMTHENELLLEAFVEKGWLYEYIEDQNNENYYKVRRREPIKTPK